MWKYFVLGLLVGWLIEWLIDWLYWRGTPELDPPHAAGSSRDPGAWQAPATAPASGASGRHPGRTPGRHGGQQRGRHQGCQWAGLPLRPR